jgi:hypothetical protein
LWLPAVVDRAPAADAAATASERPKGAFADVLARVLSRPPEPKA